MDKKVCLFTGANNGFGFEAAKELSRQGMQVVMVARSLERGGNACDEIEKATGNRPDLLIADLVYQEQARRVAREFREKYDRLDVLINNAGFPYTPRQVSEEGFEKTIALNYLAYVTLTFELLDMLKASAPARIINTSSNAHRAAVIDFDNLQGEKDFPMWRNGLPMIYPWSNLYRIMFTYELAERLNPQEIVANTFCPGFVPVSRASVSWYMNLVLRFLSYLPMARSPKEASETVVYLATDPDAGKQTGQYYYRGELMPSSDLTYDREIRKKLWNITLDWLGYDVDPLPEIT